MLPGSRFSRAIAGLPPAPEVGVLELGELSLHARSLVVEPPRITESSDLALWPVGLTAIEDLVPAPRLNEVAVDLAAGVEARNVALPGMEPPQTRGALFFRDRKVGAPIGPRIGELQPAVRRDIERDAAESLLAKLLPILLPPASTDFAHVFVLPHDLYAFQLDGIKFLTERNGKGRLLADDMGLGKTVQAVVAMRHVFREGVVTRALVVAPKSVQTSWLRHLDEWAPELQVQAIAGTSTERERQWSILTLNKAHVAVVTYATLRSDLEKLRAHEFDLLICDEIQNIKNSATKQSQAVRSLNAARRWGLTGTPLENRVDELVTILRFLDPSALPSADPDLADVRRATQDLMLRRRKDVIRDQLPAITRNMEFVELTPVQRQAYDEAEATGVAHLRGRDTTVTNVLALITRLKQICNGVDGQSAKAEWLEEYLDIAASEGDRSLVFSQYVETLNELASGLVERRPLRYTGAMSTRERDLAVETFIDERRHDVMLLSLRAGGTGLDRLQYAANRVVHFDSWWNPATMDQATARVFRIGQTKAVFETTLVAAATVEERIQLILDEKREIFAKLVDDLSVTGLPKVLSEDELFGLFGLKPPRRVSAEPPAVAAAMSTPEEPEVAVPSSQVVGAVISQQTPFGNVIAVRRILRSMRGTVWWFDPNFSRRALEELEDELDPRRVNAVRIMSRSLSLKDWRDFRRYRQEAEAQGITAEWRVSPERLFHDRFLADDDQCLNVPPVNLIYTEDAPYSEIRPSGRRPPFEEWWSRSSEPDPALIA